LTSTALFQVTWRIGILVKMSGVLLQSAGSFDSGC